MSVKGRQLTSGRLLTRNVILNLLGMVVPLFFAILAIPFLIDGLGKGRFGLLTLAWMLIGYFSLFDLGLGRAITKMIAEKLGCGKGKDVPALIWTALSLMMVMGIFGGILIILISPWLVDEFLTIPSEIKAETLNSFYLLSATIPFVIMTTGLRGILSAYQRFDIINVINIPLGISNFLAPLLALHFSRSLVPIISILVVLRFLAWSVYLLMCVRIVPQLRKSISVNKEVVLPLVNFGGWMTVSNIVGPIMVYLDRFLIGSMISMTAVTYYTTPYEVVTKLLIIPSALMGVLFPAFSANFSNDSEYTAKLYGRALKYILIVMFPVVLIISAFADSVLFIWLGSDFVENSTVVMKLLVVGVFINSLAQVPFGLVQSAGRPDLTAKLHMVELPIYIALLLWLVAEHGIAGAATAWIVRVYLDFLILSLTGQILLKDTSNLSRQIMTVVTILLIVLYFGSIINVLIAKIFFVLTTILIFFIMTWFFIMDRDERNMTMSYLK